MDGWRSRALVAGLALASAGACAPRAEFAPRTNPMVRPAHCELQEVGPFFVRGYRPDRARLRGMGFDAARYLRAVREPTRGNGTMTMVTVGWEGLGLRWNDAACRSI